MKKQLLFLTLIFSLLFGNAFSQTVYVTKTGKKHHQENCRYLSKSSFLINLLDAIAKGYDPCGVCKASSNITKTASPQKQKKETKNYSSPPSQSSQYVQCSGTTKAGSQCKRMTKSSNGKCWQHGGN